MFISWIEYLAVLSNNLINVLNDIERFWNEYYIEYILDGIDYIGKLFNWTKEGFEIYNNGIKSTSFDKKQRLEAYYQWGYQDGLEKKSRFYILDKKTSNDNDIIYYNIGYEKGLFYYYKNIIFNTKEKLLKFYILVFLKGTKNLRLLFFWVMFLEFISLDRIRALAHICLFGENPKSP